MSPAEPLFWKRSGWSQVVVGGLLLAGVLNAVALIDGLTQGVDTGYQALETGQVQLQGLQGGLNNYFSLRALAEGQSGVVATSARLEFDAQLQGPQGQVASVRVRACNFTQEEKVTSLVDRTTPRGETLTNGFILSRALAEDPQWKGLSQVSLSATSSLGPTTLPVVGTLRRSAGPILDDLCYVDLETILGVMGPSTPVTSLVLRLQPGIDASTWIDAHRDAFPSDVSLSPWEDLVHRSFPHRKEILGPLRWFLGGVAVLGALGLFLVAGNSRAPRSGLSLLLRTGRSHWWPALGALVGTAGLATLGVFILAPGYQGAILGQLQTVYPFVGNPELMWRWSWLEATVAVVVLGGALAILGRPLKVRKRVPKSPRIAHPS